MLKKLRAVLGNAITWAAAWAGWAFFLTLSLFLLAPGIVPVPVWFGYPLFAVGWEAGLLVAQYAAGMGFIGGVVFSGVLGVLYRRHTLETLRPRRLAAWGGIAGLIFPVVFASAGAALLPFSMSAGLVGSTLLFFGLPGLVTAGATVRHAQRLEAGLARRQVSDRGAG
jgi:hypothetical protein